MQLSDGKNVIPSKVSEGSFGEFSAIFVVSAGKRLADSCIGWVAVVPAVREM